MLFRSAQVAATPERVAAEAHGVSLDYAELNRRANRLASLLIALDVAPGDPVAVLVPRGLDYLAGILGIIKAGGLFLPLDTAYPGARLHLYGKAEARPGRKMGHVNRLYPKGKLPNG